MLVSLRLTYLVCSFQLSHWFGRPICSFLKILGPVSYLKVVFSTRVPKLSTFLPVEFLYSVTPTSQIYIVLFCSQIVSNYLFSRSVQPEDNLNILHNKRRRLIYKKGTYLIRGRGMVLVPSKIVLHVRGRGSGDTPSRGPRFLVRMQRRIWGPTRCKRVYWS